MTPINFKAIFLRCRFIWRPLVSIMHEAALQKCRFRVRVSLSLTLSHWSQALKHKKIDTIGDTSHVTMKKKSASIRIKKSKTKQHTPMHRENARARAQLTNSSGHSTLLSYCIMSIQCPLCDWYRMSDEMLFLMQPAQSHSLTDSWAFKCLFSSADYTGCQCRLLLLLLLILWLFCPNRSTNIVNSADLLNRKSISINNGNVHTLCVQTVIKSPVCLYPWIIMNWNIITHRAKSQWIIAYIFT